MLATVLIMALMLSSQVTTGTVGTLGTTFDYTSLINQYKPTLQFLNTESYYPVDFYFDHNVDISDNKQNYQNHVGDWDTYVVFAHAKDNVWKAGPGGTIGPFIAIEYWFYYVADNGGLVDHDHD